MHDSQAILSRLSSTDRGEVNYLLNGEPSDTLYHTRRIVALARDMAMAAPDEDGVEPDEVLGGIFLVLMLAVDAIDAVQQALEAHQRQHGLIHFPSADKTVAKRSPNIPDQRAAMQAIHDLELVLRHATDDPVPDMIEHDAERWAELVREAGGDDKGKLLTVARKRLTPVLQHVSGSE